LGMEDIGGPDGARADDCESHCDFRETGETHWDLRKKRPRDTRNERLPTLVQAASIIRVLSAGKEGESLRMLIISDGVICRMAYMGAGGPTMGVGRHL
jgi:hypothetical protein